MLHLRCICECVVVPAERCRQSASLHTSWPALQKQHAVYSFKRSLFALRARRRFKKQTDALSMCSLGFVMICDAYFPRCRNSGPSCTLTIFCVLKKTGRKLLFTWERSFTIHGFECPICGTLTLYRVISSRAEKSVHKGRLYECQPHTVADSVSLNCAVQPNTVQHQKQTHKCASGLLCSMKQVTKADFLLLFDTLSAFV